MTEDQVLQEKAKSLRRKIITMLGASKSGHPGGSLDLCEIMAVLYFDLMKYDFKNPAWPERDYLILSKGHGAPALYAVLAEGGIIGEDELLTLRKLGSRLQGHPDMKKLPGVEASTGSLGQGFSMSVGIALSQKLNQKPNRVFAILGDGELNEGLVWEAAMAAAHYRLDNLTAIIDNNGLQIDGPNREIMDVGDIGAKFAAFGFDIVHVDGHDIPALRAVLAQAPQGRPKAVIAKTVKGKGVSFMENHVGWHGAPMKEEDTAAALAELK